MSHGVSCAMLALISGGLAACDEPPVAETVPVQRQTEAHWQAYGVDRPAGEWLAMLEAGREVGPKDARARDYDALLDHAARRFTESPRMIANRLVQAQDTLQAMGEVHGMDELLNDFLAEAAGDGRLSFGTLLHHYLNLRRQGLDHGSAVAELHRTGPGGRAQ
ncbi:hypothetical protein NDN16_13180 [Aureimonas altamirensis]|uniref:hypothetical protein n=1 Tax=Aureimonas altamirensis TaxID=370622 RepID=UPI0020374412|nr:hypothetical protein [Aureimonas altamirensis]MCM2504619.1 hypothetical protein [Aureimonas altamirensis]